MGSLDTLRLVGEDHEMMSEGELDRLEAAAEQLVEDLDRDYLEAREREHELNLKLDYLRGLHLRKEESPKHESGTGDAK